MIVEYSADNFTGSIVISNPPRNLFTSPDFTSEDKLRSFLMQENLKAVIVRGAGKHFSAGADQDCLEKLSTDKSELNMRLSKGKRLLDLIRFAPVPVLAMINGSCLGAGLELALACHFRFASAGAMFGFPESGLGFLPGLGGTVALGKTVASGLAVELIISGRMAGAQEALKAGLVDKVEKAGELEKNAVNYLQQLTSDRSPHLIHSIMTAVGNSEKMSRDEALRTETGLFCDLVRSGRK